MSELRIKLPRLTPLQQQIAGSSARFNVVAGGVQSGKSTLALDIVLSSKLGALHGHPVAYLLPDDDAVESAKRRVYAMIQPLIRGRSDLNRILIGARGSIQFYAMDKKFELWDQYALVVVDDAVKIDHLLATWEDALQPLLQRYRGQAWFFGKPAGMFNNFAALAELAAGGQDSALWRMPTSDNPHADQDAVAADRIVMAPEAFEQEREGHFVQGVIELSSTQKIIGRDETFANWCDRLAADGLKVDEMPFTLDDRPAMRWIYEQIPSTIEEAFGKTLVLMKCAQVGFTVMEILAMIYMAIKFMPAKIGMYLPDQNLAILKSSERFMPILRTVPAAYRLLTEGDGSTSRKKGEGNIMVRNIASSRFYFLWTSGKGATESVPLDIISLDEVQEMRIGDMEKVSERKSASRIKYTLAGSTANWPKKDIHHLYTQGTQHQFHTECPHCGAGNVLDEYFPECIKFDAAIRDYRYVCKPCGGWIDDAQQGIWIAQFPEALILSIHFPQFLSPTISPRELIEAYYNASDMKNFYNRKLGKPYVDPSQVPVNLEMLAACATEGMRLGVRWKLRATGTFMGIDQMGSFNVVLIAERLKSGHLATIHAEEIYSNDPFARCSELMESYGVEVCVVETLPNYNDAKRFANRHPGKVFLAGYAEIKEDMLRWGDAVPNKAERKTDEQERDRYTVTLDQYKTMQVAMARIQKTIAVFPDPMGLVQEIRANNGKGAGQLLPILKDIVFEHFTKTALIAERDEEQNKYRRRVVKIGIDPHFSYAWMLLNVAFARAHGAAMFLFAEEEDKSVAALANGAQVTSKVLEAINQQRAAITEMGTCGTCISYNAEAGRCDERDFRVRDSDVACAIYLEKR